MNNSHAEHSDVEHQFQDAQRSPITSSVKQALDHHSEQLSADDQQRLRALRLQLNTASEPSPWLALKTLLPTYGTALAVIFLSVVLFSRTATEPTIAPSAPSHVSQNVLNQDVLSQNSLKPQQASGADAAMAAALIDEDEPIELLQDYEFIQWYANQHSMQENQKTSPAADDQHSHAMQGVDYERV